jgi:AmiR/NasT family two-component response regulator
MTRSVLLVDPDTERQKHITDCLRGTGFRVVAIVGSSTEALRVAAATTPDVALVATTLGDGSGMRLADRLTEEQGVPVVLLSSDGVAPSPASLEAQAAVWGLVAEPLEPATLQGALALAVGRFQELRALRRETEALRENAEARKVIERAKGLLMDVGRMSEGEAYARIRRKSMDTRRPMADIARAILLNAEVSLTALSR